MPEELQPRKAKVASLISRSTVISFGDYWTIVPKGAVLHVPSGLRSRIGGEPSGRLLPWAEFYLQNRGWLAQQPVAVRHARGEKVLPDELLAFLRRESRVVVATCHNGPISIKRPTEQAASE